MANENFSEEESVAAWFENQSIETCCAISSRAALRVFANFRAGMHGAPNDPDMSVLRALLTSAARGSRRPADIDWSAAAANAADYAAADAATDSAADSAFSASSAAAAAADSTAFSAAHSARSAAFISADSAAHSAAARVAVFSATFWDSNHLDGLFTHPVWQGAKIPEDIARNHDTVLTAMKADPAWRFWVSFYEGMWNGTFTDWDLAFEVIKIKEDDWKKGYQHIAEVIAGLEAELAKEATGDEDQARQALLDRILELEVSLLDEQNQRRGIGDNFPPEPIDDIKKAPTELVVIWEPLIALKEEADSDHARARRVNEAVLQLAKIAVDSGIWTLKKAEIVLDASLKTAGATIGASAVAILTGHGDKVRAVIEAALKWIGFLT